MGRRLARDGARHVLSRRERSTLDARDHGLEVRANVSLIADALARLQERVGCSRTADNLAAGVVDEHVGGEIGQEKRPTTRTENARASSGTDAIVRNASRHCLAWLRKDGDLTQKRTCRSTEIV